MATYADKFFEARAKAFSGEGIKMNKFLVKSDGTVKAWDSIAGYYTSVHGMSPAVERRLRTLAETS